MATVSQPFSTDDTEKEEGQGQTTLTSADTAGMPEAAPAQQSGAPSKNSGTYTNLQKYMTANQGFNQNQGGLAGQIVNTTNQYKPDIQAARSAFEQQTQPVQQQYQQAPSVVAQAIANPVAAAQDPNTYNQVAAARDATYTGPKGLEDLSGSNNFTSLQGNVNNFKSLVDAGQNESGRFDLLRQVFNRPNYSQGQQNLDNLLIQSDPNQLRQLQNQRLLASKAAQDLNSTQQYAATTGQSLARQASSLNQNTKQQLGGALTGIDTALTDQLAQAQAYNDKLKQDIAAGKLNQDEGTRIGLGSSVKELYGIDPTKFLALQDPSKQTVATADQYARYNALSKLADQVNTILPSADTAGTFNTYKNFDAGSFQNALDTARKAYESKANPVQSELTRVQNDKDYKTQELINQAALSRAGNLDSGGPDYAGAAKYGYKALPTNFLTGDVTPFNYAMASAGQNAFAPSLSEDQINKLFSGFGQRYIQPDDQQTDQTPHLGGEDAAQRILDFIHNDGLNQSIADNASKLAQLKKQFGLGKSLEIT